MKDPLNLGGIWLDTCIGELTAVECNAGSLNLTF